MTKEYDEIGDGGYNLIASGRETTVVGHYERQPSAAETGYQTEAQLEGDLLDQLCRQGYERVAIHCEAELKANLRRQIERLNKLELTDAEWERFFKEEIAAANKGIEEKAQTIQADPVKAFTMDDGRTVNIRLIDKTAIHANTTQVMNQYTEAGGKRENRYDVTILVNGLPLVHVELKRRGVALKEAFNQINRYGRESFWAGSGLFEYVQVFVISNGTETKYYSNTTRDSHVKEQAGACGAPRTRTCNSFEFTSYWSDAGNRVIADLRDFAATFFSRHTLLSILTRYCVLTEQKALMLMRPYQIAATERLLNRVEVAHNMRAWGSRDACGYIWHTTGSGKTLTSFKAAQLLSTSLSYIAKVLFVVDRKDLDYQTMKEYDRFEKGAANGNNDTKTLKRQLEDPKCRIIITTIQKLSTFAKQNKSHAVYDSEVALIFDECHRSQFGDMHSLISSRFKRYYLFGFTGTPIFAENISAAKGALRTTEDVFGRRLHSYTIVDAIRDHNVLPFRVDYVATIREKEEVESSPVWDIAREEALEDPRRVSLVTRYIMDHFAQQTKRDRSYEIKRLANTAAIAADKRHREKEQHAAARVSGFNSIMAVQNIPLARLYYEEFKRQNAAQPANKRLKVATIFSYSPNEADPSEADENSDSAEGLEQSSRDFLESAIADYNKTFGTSYDTSADEFPSYYKDISLRMKNRELDLLIVVNMFLTGFDATTLNTLWVDKNLRYHGLLQAYSRTNRILNSVKTFGNIVCFRNLEDETNKALALFGDKDARSVSLLRSFADYLEGYTDERGRRVPGYRDAVGELERTCPAGARPLGEKAEKEFIALFGNILRLRNILTCFDGFASADPLTERQMQDYQSIYLDLRDKYRPKRHDKADISDDVVFEIELVKQVEVNIDYILALVAQFQAGHKADVEIRARISKAIDSSPDLRDKKDLIESFIESLTPDDGVGEQWSAYVNERKRAELERIIDEEGLKPDGARRFMADAFQRGYVSELGTGLDNIMPPINPFIREANRMGRKMAIVERLRAFFNRFYDVADGEF